MAFKVKFRIKRVNYRREESSYTICRATILKNYSKRISLPKTVTIKGDFAIIFKDDDFLAEVEYYEDDFSQPVLTLTSLPTLITPQSKVGMSKLLARRIQGLGVKKAGELVDKLGLNIIEIINQNPDVLDQFSGINLAKKNSICNQLSQMSAFEELAIFIQSIGFPISIADRIFGKYKDRSIHILREDPYQICYDKDISFQIADTIALQFGTQDNQPMRIRMGLLDFFYQYSYSNGNICCREKNVLKMFPRHMNRFSAKKRNRISEEELFQQLDRLVMDKRLIKEELKDKVYYYLPTLYRSELDLTTQVKRCFDWIPPFCTELEIDNFLEDYEQSYYTLDPLQKEAVYIALLGHKRNKKTESRISILTGGPGTGKTATTNVIVQAITEIGLAKPKKPTIRLLAPTGRAAQRMTELSTSQQQSSTIHSGLQMKPWITNLTVIEEDFVIVDEGSMIDIDLMCKLLSNISETTRILLVGDIDQLPSVGPGSVLKDFIRSKVIPTVSLKTIFRQAAGSKLVSNAHHIINGDTIENGFDVNNQKGDNFLFTKESNTTKIKELLLDKIRTYIRKYSLSEICLLTAMKDGDLGTKELNLICQSTFNPAIKSREEYTYEDDMRDVSITFRTGDKVLHTRNNKELKVRNGYVGIITEIHRENKNGQEVPVIIVDYEAQGQTVTYMGDKQICELDLAYAMTIHKSQGSEYPVVLTPMHLSQEVMLNKNLFYTDITRAREICEVIGQTEAIDFAIKNKDAFNRESLLSQRIAA